MHMLMRGRGFPGSTGEREIIAAIECLLCAASRTAAVSDNFLSASEQHMEAVGVTSGLAQDYSQQGVLKK